MKALPLELRTAIKKVKASGKGGVDDEQRVIVRAETGRLVLIGIGGTETSCSLKYDGEPMATITSLVGLRCIANVLLATDEVEVTVCERSGVTVAITSYRNHGRDVTLRSTSNLAPRN